MFSYDPGQINPDTGQPVSAIRFLLQDTVEELAEFTDAEIVGVYQQTPSSHPQRVRVYYAAALLAEALYRRYSRDVSFSAGDLKVNYELRRQHWQLLANELAQTALRQIGEGLVWYTERGVW
jgi:hypothetical protein